METKLWSALIGLSKTVDSNPKTENTDTIIINCLQHLRNHTVTQDLIDLVHKEKGIDASNSEFKGYSLYLSWFMLLRF